MKSLLKKVLVLVLALSCALGAFMGCGGTEDPNNPPEEPVDPDRTPVWVTIINDGMGIDWMKYDVKAGFEKMFPEYQLLVDTNYREANLEEMADSHFDVYLNARDSYKMFAGSGYLGDITEWITEPCYDENYNLVPSGGTVSIKDRMPESYQTLYNHNGSYYATPYYEGIWGIWYDHDLLGPDGEDLLNYGNGPDGIEGTTDDGLPRTWKEFLSLLDEIRGAGLVPFCASDIDYVRKGMFDAFVAAYEGKHDFDINFSFNGTLQTPVKGANGEDIYEINANPGSANFKYLAKQYGRLAALTMINEIVKPENFSDASYKGGHGHTDAQAEFVQSIQMQNKGKRVAMFMEGAYWHNEARPVFAAMEKLNPNYGYGKRDFRYMALPKFDGSDSSGVPETKNYGKTTMYSTGSDAFIFVNAKSASKPEVKAFYQYLNSNEGCFLNVKGSCAPRTIATKFTKDQLAELAPVTQNIYAYKAEPTYEMCYELSTCKTRYNQYDRFLTWFHYTKVSDGTVTNNPWSYLISHPGKANVEDYYNGQFRYWNSVRYDALG